MKRDFTQESLDQFREMIRDMQDDQWEWLDFITDRLYGMRHWLQKIGILEETEDLAQYHREVLDRENASVDDIVRIFEQVSDADTRYGSAADIGFGYCRETLNDYIRAVKTLTEIAVGACEAAAGGQTIGDHFAQPHVYIKMSMIDRSLKAKLQAIEFTADTFNYLSEAYKAEVVRDYEAQHPDQAELIDKVLSDPALTDQEKQDIKFLIYTAPEPYRSIYLEHIKKYDVNLHSGGSYYSPGSGEIYLKDADSTFGTNPRGPYNTFFHESGHAIDDYEKGFGDITGSFRYDGKSLNECITQDVRNYVENHIDSEHPELTEAQKEKLLRSLNLTDDASYQYEGSDANLDPVLQAYRDEIVAYMNKDLGGDVNECPSDVYGGVTNNAIVGSWGHYKDSSASTYTYWYNGKKPTGAQESELWAEFFAAQMTQDEAALASIRKHFPEAYKAMEAMAQEMVSN